MEATPCRRGGASGQVLPCPSTSASPPLSAKSWAASRSLTTGHAQGSITGHPTHPQRSFHTRRGVWEGTLCWWELPWQQGLCPLPKPGTVQSVSRIPLPNTSGSPEMSPQLPNGQEGCTCAAVLCEPVLWESQELGALGYGPLWVLLTFGQSIYHVTKEIQSFWGALTRQTSFLCTAARGGTDFGERSSL